MPAVVVKEGVQTEESYLVDMRSRTGFSGSPVHVYILPIEYAFNRKPRASIETGRLHGPWMLGLHWGQMPLAGPLPRLNPRELSGMSAIVPGHFIKSFLMEDEVLMRQRREIEKEEANRNTAVREGASAMRPSAPSAKSEPPTMEGDEQHRERFTATLISAAKKRPQGG